MKCIGATLTVVSSAAVVWSRHTTPSIPSWRETALRDETNNGCESRLHLLPFLKQRENHNYLSTVSCQKNTIPRNFTSKSKLQFCFISNRTKAKTYCDLEWVKKRIILQRRLLDWLLPIWTLPPVCEIRDKMQVVCKELTHDWAKSTIVRS